MHVLIWLVASCWIRFDTAILNNIYGESVNIKDCRVKDTRTNWNLDKDLDLIRKNFPILDKCVYLISNSLGAVPVQVRDALDQFYTLWAEEGVTAWEKDWWLLSQKVGDKVASVIGAEENTVAMMTNATLCHWVALSTQFSSAQGARNKVVMTDHDFPSVIYAAAKICSFMNWKLDLVGSRGKPGIEVDEILKRVDDKTLFVATSHVYFKSAYIQDISRIAQHARQKGALTLIDGYHAPGTVPVNVKDLSLDFYCGGCLKWLCGGPGNAFLYVHPDRQKTLEPSLTGWLAHKNPFAFSRQMEYTEGAYRLMSGTPPVSCLYTAKEGMDIIQKIGINSIRKKSTRQTRMLINNSLDRGFSIHTPSEDEKRGGAVSIGLPNAHQVKQALIQRKVKVDFRKGMDAEPDVVRVGPHFYTRDEEIGLLFRYIDEIFDSGEYKKFSSKSEIVT
jgi:kynureninase